MSPIPSVQTKFAPLMTVADFLDWPGERVGAKIPARRRVPTRHGARERNRVHAYLWRRDAQGAWPSDPQEISGVETLLTLDSIGMTCPLGEAYANTYLAR